MFIPLSSNVHHHSYQSSLSNGSSRTSLPSNFKRPIATYADFSVDAGNVPKKRRSDPFAKMQQHTTNEPGIGVASRLCSVCGDISTGIHFGGNSCESCKAFFRRSVQCLRFQNYKCSGEERCPVNIVTRKVCQFCRYTKCTAIGMKPKWVLSDQEREEKYGARRKRFRENRTTEEDPDIYKHLNKEEKLLVEDIAHALYQSRATYPLNFPSPSVLFSTASPDASSNAPSPGGEKPASASANLLIVPIQRLVLFARMLKDFDLFSEDDKVCLLKGSAIEMMVCSSSTLFNPKTHTFTNYLSRDQRAIMDDQIMPLDPLLTRLWGEEIFNRTRSYLISMCNLHVDEVTSTLLAPVLLFSPDRLNINDMDLVKRLQMKYATLLRKYMNWRYGVDHTDNIYPKLLLQIVNIRTLSLAHGEVIQKLMATSSVNPLVQEVTVKQELLNRATTDRMDSLSISSASPLDMGIMDFDKTPSKETESNNGSDEDDYSQKQSRPSMDDDFNFDDYDESNPSNIWRKRRKLSTNYQMSSFMSTATLSDTNTGGGGGGGGGSSSMNNPSMTSTQLKGPINMLNTDPYAAGSAPTIRPYDHQVPSNLSLLQDDVMLMSSSGYPPNQNDFRHLSAKKQGLVASPQAIQQLQQLYRAHASPGTDLASYDFDPRSNSMFNASMSPASRQFFDDPNSEAYRQSYTQPSPGIFPPQDTEEQMHLLSIASNPTPSPAFSAYLNDHQSHASATPPAPTPLPTSSVLNNDEQQLLDAIHAHPNKRDLVMNLLRQMNASPSTGQQQQQQSHPAYPQRQSNPSTPYDPYQEHSNMEDDE